MVRKVRGTNQGVDRNSQQRILVGLRMHGVRVHMVMHVWRGRCVALGGIAAARAATAAAAIAADCFGYALVSACFHSRRFLYKRPFGVHLAAGGLIDLFFVTATVAVGDTFSANALATPGNAKVFTFALVLSLWLFRDL